MSPSLLTLSQYQSLLCPPATIMLDDLYLSLVDLSLSCLSHYALSPSPCSLGTWYPGIPCPTSTCCSNAIHPNPCPTSTCRPNVSHIIPCPTSTCCPSACHPIPCPTTSCYPASLMLFKLSLYLCHLFCPGIMKFVSLKLVLFSICRPVHWCSGASSTCCPVT